MQKKKKFFSLVLSIIMILSTMNLAFASTTTATDSRFSPDTVITEDNVNDILKYYGLDPSNIKKNDNMPVNIKVTVRDLEKALIESSKLPKTIIQNDYNPTNSKVTNGQVKASASGTATAYYLAKITSSLNMNYSATGQYYSSGSTKYWTSAGPANITVATPPTSLYFYQIDSITKLTNTVVNANTSSSYLKMEYSYAVGYYMFVGVGYILLNSIGVYGSTNFGTSYIP